MVRKDFSEIELERKKQAKKMREWRAKNPRPYSKIELTLNGKKLSAQLSQLKQSSIDSLVGEIRGWINYGVITLDQQILGMNDLNIVIYF